MDRNPIPDVLDDRYELMGKLGEGGMGVVYQCLDRRTGMEYAVKFLTGRRLGSEEDRLRFERQYVLLSRFRHPNVIQLCDYGVADGVPYVIMELCRTPSGKPFTLRDLQRRAPEHRLPAVTLMALIPPILDAVAYLHSRGIVHRDLKPENILLQTDLQGQLIPKLSDFGLVTMTADEEMHRQYDMSSTMAMQPHSQHDRALVGTYAYMSPEQKRGESLDARTDVYSLGLIFYGLATGYERLNPDLPSEVNPDLPSWLDDLVERALAPDPGRRWPAAGAMFNALPPGLRKAERRARHRLEGGRSGRSARAVPYAVVVAVVAVVLALSGVWWFRRGPGAGPKVVRMNAEPRSVASPAGALPPVQGGPAVSRAGTDAVPTVRPAALLAMESEAEALERFSAGAQNRGLPGAAVSFAALRVARDRGWERLAGVALGRLRSSDTALRYAVGRLWLSPGEDAVRDRLVVEVLAGTSGPRREALLALAALSRPDPVATDAVQALASGPQSATVRAALRVLAFAADTAELGAVGLRAQQALFEAQARPLPEVPAAEYVAAKLGPEDLRGFVTSVGPAAGLWLMGAVQRTGDPGAALAWLEALVPVADTRLLPALSGIVSRAPDPAVGVAAAQVVCRTLGAEALYPLLLEAETPARERVLQAVRAESLRFGADLVLESRYVGVRRAVVELLGRIGGEAQVARLRRLAEKDLDSTVRTAAEIAAARIEERRGELMQGMSASPLLRDLVLQFEVAAAAGDAGGEERALRSMVQTSDRGAVLVRRLLDNEVARLRLSGLRVTPENAWSGRLGRMVRVLAGADRAGAENLRTLAQDLQGEAESVVVARGLALCSHGSVVQALADLSRSPFARARIAAVDGLVGRQHVTAYTAVEDLLEDGDASVRAHAAGAVGRLGRREAVTALQRLLGDGNDAVRTAALEALMRLVPAEEAAEIGVAALSDPSGAVRWAAITALVRGRDPVQPAWLASLEPSPGRVVGLAELFAILGVDPQAVQRDGPGEPASDPLETVGRLSRALQGRVEPVSPDVPGPAGNSVLIAAARFEQFLSRDRVELRPGQRVQQGTSDRVEALEALISGRGDPGVLQAVLARNRGGGAEVSATVCLAMGCSQAPGTAEALVDLLSEPSRMEVRLASELALALLGGRAVSAAEAGLDEGMPPALTVRLLRVLGLTGADAGAAVLESRLQDPGAPRELLPATLYAIGLGGRLETVEAALPFLHDPQIQVRTAAADAVAAVGSELLDALVEVLGDDDPVGRQAAVYALGQIPGQQAERLLQQALGDTDPFVRQLAGSALLDRRLR